MKRNTIPVLLGVILIALLLVSACGGGAAPTATVTKTVSTTATVTTTVSATTPTTPTTPTTVTTPTYRWDFYSPYDASPAGAMWWWVNEMAADLKELTNGQFELTVYIQGEHPYAIFDMLKCISDIHPQIVDIPFAQVTGEDPRLGVSDLPMLFPTDTNKFYELLDTVLFPDYFTPILENDYGYTPGQIFSWLPQRIGLKDRFVENWDSLQGQKVRIWNPQLADLITLLGGLPQSISWGEVYTSLQTGLVDGVITNSGGMYTSKFFEILKNVTVAEVQLGGYAYCVSTEALAELPDDIADIVMTYIKSREADIRAGMMKNHNAYTLASITEYGVKLQSWSPEFVTDLRSKCYEAVWKPWIERSGGAQSEGGQAFNSVAKILIAAGNTVPGYTPY